MNLISSVVVSQGNFEMGRAEMPLSDWDDGTHAQAVVAGVHFPHAPYSYVGVFQVVPDSILQHRYQGIAIPTGFYNMGLVWGLPWNRSVRYSTTDYVGRSLSFLHRDGGIVRMVTLYGNPVGDKRALRA